MPQVLNRTGSRYLTAGTQQVYIGRPSKWGNPFVIGRDGARAEVIEHYRSRLMRSPELLADLHELRGKDLVCYCAPAACHGDVLLELANASDLAT